MTNITNMEEWDGLDLLYEAVWRLYRNKCDLTYIQGEVERSFEQIHAASELKKRSTL